MATDNVTIPKKINGSKEPKKTDRHLIRQLISSLEDVKRGRIKRVA